MLGSIAFVMIVQALMTDVTYGTCPANLNSTQVAYMCEDSKAEGDHVYIDTRLANKTDNGTGILCQCSVTFIYDVKVFAYNISGSAEECGSKLSLNVSDGRDHITDDKTCSVSGKSTPPKGVAVEIGLEKVREPFSVDYCVDIKLRICGTDKFQCNDGECIALTHRCDASPDCNNEDDEDACTSNECSEGQEFCAVTKKCIGAGIECKNNTYQTVENSRVKTEQLIKISCTRSQRFVTTTASSTSTSTTSTTPTTILTTTTSIATTPQPPITNSSSTAPPPPLPETSNTLALSPPTPQSTATTTNTTTPTPTPQPTATTTNTTSPTPTATTTNTTLPTPITTNRTTTTTNTTTPITTNKTTTTTNTTTPITTNRTTTNTTTPITTNRTTTTTTTPITTNRTTTNTNTTTPITSNRTTTHTNTTTPITTNRTTTNTNTTTPITSNRTTTTLNTSATTSAYPVITVRDISTDTDITKGKHSVSKTQAPGGTKTDAVHTDKQTPATTSIKVTLGTKNKAETGGSDETDPMNSPAVAVAIIIGILAAIAILVIIAVFVKKSMKSRIEYHPEMWVSTYSRTPVNI